MMHPMASVASLSMLLTACVMTPVEEGLTYSAPTKSENRAVTVQAQSRSEAVELVAARLRAAGIRPAAVEPRSGMMVARVAGAQFVDCGTFTQLARGSLTTFPANAERAAIFDVTQPGQINVREVSVRSQYTVSIGSGPPFAATIEGSHAVRVRQSSKADDAKAWRADREFGVGSAAAFPDRVTCVDSGLFADVVAGR